MSFSIGCCNLDDVHHTLMSKFARGLDNRNDESVYESAPRGKPIREMLGASFTILDPRDRLISSKVRAVNYGFAVGELCWYLRGDTDLATMRYYNKRMAQFSDDGVTINSAYGHRIFKTRYLSKYPTPQRSEYGLSQFDLVVEELKRDPDSRRAVMHINEPSDLLRAVEQGSKDVPCTLSLQLLIRDRLLHMHVSMRSNDVVWGLPYDVFSFTCLQEAFLYKLQEAGVQVDDLGYYHHSAGSLHIYDTHFGMAEQVSNERPVGIAPMKPFTLEDLEWLSEDFEPIIRRSVEDPGLLMQYPDEDEPRDETLEWMITKLIEHRNKRIEENTNKEKNVEQT